MARRDVSVYPEMCFWIERGDFGVLGGQKIQTSEALRVARTAEAQKGRVPGSASQETEGGDEKTSPKKPSVASRKKCRTQKERQDNK